MDARLNTALQCLLIILLVVITGIFCGDASVSFVKAVTPSSVVTTNVWSKSGVSKNLAPVNPLWQNSNHTTTPWPDLGAKRRPSKLPNSAAQSSSPQNRNIGVDLSYGLNYNQNSPNVKQSKLPTDQNIGVALSYGLNPKPQQTAGSVNQKQQGVTNSKQVLQTLNSIGNKTNPTPIPAKTQSPKDLQTPSKGSTNITTNPTKSTPPVSLAVNPGRQNQLATSVIGSPTEINNKTKKDTFTVEEDNELREFSEALLKKDVNNAAKYITINYQGKTTSRSMNDEAPLPLLTVKSEAFDIPTIARLQLLHNNYILETNANEHVTPQEKAEENSLLDAMLSTPIMHHTRNFLIQKEKLSKDPKDFRDKLKEIWFNMYSRGGGKIGSSGFEHVFVAELKGDDVSGLHNWFYFHDAETKKLANYLGHLKKIEFGNKGAILKHHFTFSGKDKPVGSMFIGTSPELEIALYSTCFLLRPDRACPLRLDGNDFIIRTYTYRYRGKNMIGSAFPEI